MNNPYTRLNKHFDDFADEIMTQFNFMVESGNPLVRVSPKDSLFTTYLENIKPEDNPIFRERRYFDGNYDHNFIRRVGNLAMITPEYKLVSLWDFDSHTLFENARKAMSKSIHDGQIVDIYLEKERVAGHKPNKDNENPDIIWEHYYVELPNKLVNTRNIDTKKHEARDAHDVLKRTVQEVNIDDLNTIIDLIKENNLYRGQEFLSNLQKWVKLKKDYDKTPSEEYLWFKAIQHGRSIRYRSTVIGTLISDLYDGVELEKAIHSYESKVAPHNYKRPKSIVTTKMVEEAKETLEKLGFLDSIYRRPAKLTDIPSDKILFTSQEQKAFNVFDDMTKDSKASTKKSKVEDAKEMSIHELLNELKDLQKLELLPTHSLQANQIVLTEALNQDAPSPCLWSNTLSWAYINSDTADAITMRVKNAGGNVDGDVRVSLSWDNKDDLDLSVYKDNDEYDCIYYGRRRELGGELDVDANAHSIVDEPVENIFWKSINNLANGKYTVKVNNFNKRTNENQGFTLQFATTEGIQTFTYPDNDVNHKPFLVFEKENNTVKLIQISEKLQCQSNTVSGDKFIEVKHVLMSPNTWEKEIGNKHFILLTDNVEVNEPVRGFFNEQLNSKLSPHRKVTEILGSKLKIQAADFEPTDVAKGYGFSETMDANLILRLTYSNGRKELVHVSIK